MVNALRASITRSASSPARGGWAVPSSLPRSSTILWMKCGWIR
jgi:hypothetical protein